MLHVKNGLKAVPKKRVTTAWAILTLARGLAVAMAIIIAGLTYKGISVPIWYFALPAIMLIDAVIRLYYYLKWKRSHRWQARLNAEVNMQECSADDYIISKMIEHITDNPNTQPDEMEIYFMIRKHQKARDKWRELNQFWSTGWHDLKQIADKAKRKDDYCKEAMQRTI